MESPSVVVKAEEVHKTYHAMEKPVHALRGLSLTVNSGDYVAIVGPSGCGKSTFLHVLGALDTPNKGEIFWHDQPISRWSEKEKTRLRLEKIGFVFQRFYLLPMLSAAENIELPMREMELDRKTRSDRIDELLAYVNLSDRRNHKPSQLSGGEMQRVALARALANRPELLLADEPTGELDVATGEEIAKLFQRLNKDGLTLVVVTHNPDLANTAGKTLRMRDGQWE